MKRWSEGVVYTSKSSHSLTVVGSRTFNGIGCSTRSHVVRLLSAVNQHYECAASESVVFPPRVSMLQHIQEGTLNELGCVGVEA